MTLKNESQKRYVKRHPRTIQAQFLKNNSDTPLTAPSDLSIRKVARTTTQYWQLRYAEAANYIPPDTLRFFETTEEGIALGVRLMYAALYTFNKKGACGLEQIAEFLSLSGLDRFSACSKTALYAMSQSMDDCILQFGQEERQRLAPTMPHRKITVAQDETFFQGEMVLVAICAISGFIFVERKAEERTQEAWDNVMREATADLNITIVQSTSDEAPGLVAHAKNGLGVHHSPDLFHVVQNVFKAFNPCFNSCRRSIESAIDQSKKEIMSTLKKMDRSKEALEIDEDDKRPEMYSVIHPLAHDLKDPLNVINESEDRLEQLDIDRKEVSEAVHRFSDAYHPVNFTDGTLNKSSDVEAALKLSIDFLGDKSKEYQLSEKLQKVLNRVSNMLPDLTSTIDWFLLRVKECFNELGLGEDWKSLFDDLVALEYLKLAHHKGRDAQQKGSIQQLINRRSEEIASSPLWGTLNTPDSKRIKEQASQTAQLFQRSSSCVEGRNGKLSLHYHGIHKLTQRRLEVMTIIHNYDTRRHDHKTPAECFFGKSHADLFEYILKRMPIPNRSRNKKSVINLDFLNDSAA